MLVASILPELLRCMVVTRDDAHFLNGKVSPGQKIGYKQ